jgi:phosphotriesterase-related protein
MPTDEGKIVTVTGTIPPEDLGTTLAHEHVFIDLVGPWFEQPDSAYERKLAREPVSLENYWMIEKNQLSVKDNGRLESFDDAVDEVARFSRAGGSTIVDVTPKNVGGDPRRVRAVGRETDVQFVHGTGYYTQKAHPDHVGEATVEDLAEEFVDDVRTGIDDTRVRAGIIGELGVSGEIHDDEEKVLRAGARAALETGAPVTVHPTGRGTVGNKNQTYPSSRWGLDILDVLTEEGLSPSRVVMSHMDRDRFELTAESLEYQRELADRGAYLEYDLWGNEKYYTAQFDKKPSDPERVEAVVELVEDGYIDRLLFSHDVAFKDQLVTYGGFGYSHILEHVVPMLRMADLTPDQITTILTENPREVLTFAEPE